MINPEQPLRKIKTSRLEEVKIVALENLKNLIISLFIIRESGQSQ